MECPVCHHNLRRVGARGAEIDIYPRCKGKWFDEGEFTDFVRELSQKEGIAPRRDRLFEARQVWYAYIGGFLFGAVFGVGFQRIDRSNN